MNRYAYGYPRRRTSRTRQHIGCIVLAVAGIGIGIGGSVLWPWGFAHPPHSLDVEQEPAPGVLLLSGEDAAVVQAERRQLAFAAIAARLAAIRATASRVLP